MQSNRHPPPRTIRYGKIFLAEGTTFRLRHVDNASRGLRFVGFADALAPLRHKGWVVGEDGETLFPGVVYQLPARHSTPRFIAGFADPTDPDNSTFLDFSDIYTSAIDAAIDADTIAQFCAEGKRAWNEANLARMDFAECENVINRYCRSIRHWRLALRQREAPSVEIFARVRNCFEEIRFNRRRMEGLEEAFGHHAGWKAGGA